MADYETKRTDDTQITPERAASPSGIWPPPPQYQPQTIPVRGMSPWHVFVFYASRSGAAGAGIGAISVGAATVLIGQPLAAVVTVAFGAVGGLFLGFAIGILLGILAAGLYAYGITSNAIGRILCWFSPALIGLIALCYLNANHSLAFLINWQVFVSLAIMTILCWQAYRTIARQFVGKF